MSTWRNWARTATCTPAQIVTPADEAELLAVIGGAADRGWRVRADGAGHSFTPIAVTDGVLVHLDALSGLRAVDLDTGLVTLGAGTRLRDLPRLLGPLGLGLENMGDIDTQSIAGAISTGTHGTGAHFTGLAGQVRGLRIVLADGSVRTCSPTQDAELFQVARLGLGAVGLITEVTLQCVPAFLLAAQERPVPLEEMLTNFDALITSTDHVEFYWFPHTETALLKADTRLPVAAGVDPIPRWRSLIDDELVSNGLLSLVCRAGNLAPAIVPSVNRVAARMVSTRSYTDHAPAVFTSPRRVRFREMEYGIDRDALPTAVREIRQLIRDRGWRISFPLELRVAAADDVWLSTAAGRPTAYVAVHRYLRDPFASYFLAVEQILLRYGGRPHWGKLHSLDAERLAPLYPRFEQVRELRARLDPTGRWSNAALDRVFGTVGRGG